MRESRWDATSKYHGDSSSDYSSSRSPPRRRNHYAYSSSDSSASSGEEETVEREGSLVRATKRDSIPPPPGSLQTVALGRRLNLPKELAGLTRNCQFVKKIRSDPGLQNNFKERPSYMTAADISGSEGAPVSDPRAPRDAYLSTLGKGGERLQPVEFLWNEYSRGRPPSTQVLLAGFSSTILSKSLLVSLLVTAMGSLTAEDIIDVQLASGQALFSFQRPAASSAVVKWLGRHAVGSEQWTASFDPDGKKFHKLTKAKDPLIGPKGGVLSRSLSSDLSSPGRSKRNRDAPCILVSYSIIPPSESSREIKECFRRCRIHTIERGKSHWRICLADEGEVEYVRRWRSDLKYRGRPLDLSFEEDRMDSDKRRDRHHSLEGEGRRMSTASHVPLPTVPRPERKVSLPAGKADSRGNLEALYRPLGSLSSMAAIKVIPTGYPASETAADDSPLSLPTFNRRILERRRAEEEAAAFAAEKARLELEKRIAEEEVRRAAQKEVRDERRSKEPANPSSLSSEPLALRMHESGSSRTEGFYAQHPDEKTIYIEDIANLIQSMAASSIAASSRTAAHSSSTGSSRSNRAQNRRLQASLENVKSDLFGKTSVFTARKKRLIVARSSIHSWGLFAGEDIESGDMVVEYVGELIRESVANVRERRYELALQAKGSTEMASSYLFRLSSDLVIDATHKGNMSRFVNHSCDPTCVARVVSADVRRIVMYARRDIRKGEEITYDYKFPLEDDPHKKIKCLCGSRNCRGTLN